MRAKDVMSTPVQTVTPETSFKNVAAILTRFDISAVPVVDEAGELLGIVSEADFVPLQAERPSRRGHVGHELKLAPRTAGEAMVRDVVTVRESAAVGEVAGLMLRHGVKRIPVVAGNQVIGIVSRHDLVKTFVRPDEEIAAELDSLLSDEIVMLGRFRAQVTGGFVTLCGPNEQRERRLAELLARSVPGVIDVSFEAKS